MNYLKLLLVIVTLTVSSSAFAQFFEEDHLITDVRNNIIWLRCSVGQTWDNEAKTCTGALVKLNHDEIEDAQWFTRDELLNFDAQGKFLPRKLSISRRLIDDWLYQR